MLYFGFFLLLWLQFISIFVPNVKSSIIPFQCIFISDIVYFICTSYIFIFFNIFHLFLHHVHVYLTSVHSYFLGSCSHFALYNFILCIVKLCSTISRSPLWTFQVHFLHVTPSSQYYVSQILDPLTFWPLVSQIYIIVRFCVGHASLCCSPEIFLRQKVLTSFAFRNFVHINIDICWEREITFLIIVNSMLEVQWHQVIWGEQVRGMRG